MEENKAANRYGKRAFRIIVISLISMIVVGVGSAVLFYSLTGRLYTTEEPETVTYDRHYAFIVSNDDSEFWNEVYASICDEAALNNIYIENMEDSLGVNYSDTDLLRVAINSSVDGIIYGGTTDDTAASLIDEAVNDGIAVVILQNDIEASMRQCFVGVNNYELGQMYASQISKLAENYDEAKPITADILVNISMNEGASNVIAMAIEDYFSDNYPDMIMPELQIIRVNTEDTFSVEEDIKKLFMKEENLPDIMLCLNSIYTQCVYQAIIDQNKVGDVSVVGYFANKSILEAIDKKIIYSTISVDTEEMGRDSVQALMEYEDTGYTNSYVPISTQVIGRKEAKALLYGDKKNE